MGRSGGGGGGFSGGFSGGGGRSGGFSGRSGRSGGLFGGGRSGGPMGGRPGSGHSHHGYGGYHGGFGGRSGGFLGGFLGGLIGSSLNNGGGGGGNGMGNPNGMPPVQDPQNNGQGNGSGNGTPPNNGSPGNGPDPGYPGGAPGRSGCLALIIIAVALAILSGAFFGVGGCSAVTVTPSTTERTPLPAGAVTQTAYYTDEDGSFIANPSVLNAGMRSFYQDTGVQPYLYILPNGQMTSTGQLASYAEELYGEMFEDTAHFLVVFCDDGKGSYNVGYYIGAQAGTVLDDEAIEIFSDFLAVNYSNYDITESQAFANTFEETGARIMSVTPPYMLIAIVVIALALAAAAIAYAVKRRADQREREQQRMEEILSTPLETFGDQELEELAKKYNGDGGTRS